MQWPGNLSVRRMCVQKNWGECHDAVGEGLSLREMVKTIVHVMYSAGTDNSLTQRLCLGCLL